MTGGLTVPESTTPAPVADGPNAVEAPANALPRALAWLAVVPVLVMAVDQLSKQLTLTYLTGQPPLRLLWGAVYLNLTRNGGAAFSIGENYTFIFPIIAVVVVGAILYLARRLRSVPWAVSLGLIMGGALGNVIDRVFRAPGVFRGHVVDMISLFDEAGRVFPAGAIFNVADSALFCGVVMAIYLELTGRHRDGTRQKPGRSPGSAIGAPRDRGHA